MASQVASFFVDIVTDPCSNEICTADGIKKARENPTFMASQPFLMQAVAAVSFRENKLKQFHRGRSMLCMGRQVARTNLMGGAWPNPLQANN